MLTHTKTAPGGTKGGNMKPNINYETEKQIDDLQKKFDDKEFEKMTKNMNRFCGNLDACMPLLFGALQVNLNHIGTRFEINFRGPMITFKTTFRAPLITCQRQATRRLPFFWGRCRELLESYPLCMTTSRIRTHLHKTKGLLLRWGVYLEMQLALSRGVELDLLREVLLGARTTTTIFEIISLLYIKLLK